MTTSTLAEDPDFHIIEIQDKQSGITLPNLESKMIKRKKCKIQTIVNTTPKLLSFENTIMETEKEFLDRIRGKTQTFTVKTQSNSGFRNKKEYMNRTMDNPKTIIMGIHSYPTPRVLDKVKNKVKNKVNYKVKTRAKITQKVKVIPIVKDNVEDLCWLSKQQLARPYTDNRLQVCPCPLHRTLPRHNLSYFTFDGKDYDDIEREMFPSTDEKDNNLEISLEELDSVDLPNHQPVQKYNKDIDLLYRKAIRKSGRDIRKWTQTQEAVVLSTTYGMTGINHNPPTGMTSDEIQRQLQTDMESWTYNRPHCTFVPGTLFREPNYRKPSTVCWKKGPSEELEEINERLSSQIDASTYTPRIHRQARYQPYSTYVSPSLVTYRESKEAFLALL